MSEKKEARRDGAKQQKNSGRGQNKGDALWCGYVVDYKETGKTFSLSRKVWSKVVSDTMDVSVTKDPCIKLIFVDDDRPIRLGIIEWERLVYLEERLKLLESLIEREGIDA